MTIQELQGLKESEDKVEFKEAKTDFPWNGGSHSEQKDRRKCFLGYIVALANEGGGYLVLGMADKTPHNVVGSNFSDGKLGELEDAVYEKLGIRVHIEELFDSVGLRVVLTNIPSRPVGRTLKFEGVPLMRTGDSLRNMTDEEVFKILSEQEPDFSAKICTGLQLSDLDETAITILKERYAKKQNNPSFLKLSTSQILTDLYLMQDGRITYAALILVGNEKVLKEHLPNAQVNIEYRQTHAQTHFDKREVFLKPLFISIDEIWKYLNTRNRDHKISEGPYKFDLPYFNEEVIREAVLNAIAHRDYTITSETVVKQYPNSVIILNAGGFPIGVTKENLISVNSVPRSRLLTEILEKTGLVERSGQGVDKIFRITLSEGKPEPDYSKTGILQVELRINGEIEDKAFAAFISSEQEKRDEDNKLGTYEIIGLHDIKEGKSDAVDSSVLESLEKEGVIKRVGGGASTKYVLPDEYFILKNRAGEIGGFRTIDLERILYVADRNEKAKMGDFIENFKDDLNRDQVRYLIEKLIGTVLIKEGSGSGTYYKLVEGVKDIDDMIPILDNA
jgi:ATP-dependent DNA helicase RecG